MSNSEVTGGLLNDLLAHNRVTQPNAPAVTDATETVDWAALERRAGQFAAYLDRQGIGRGSRVALWMPNGIDYVAAIFGTARCGAIAVNINTRFGVAEVADLVQRSRASLLLTNDGFGAVDFMNLLDRVPAEALRGLDAIVSTTPSSRTRVHGVPVKTLERNGEMADRSAPDDLCLTFTTSGTTSKPKLVAHRQSAISQHGRDVAGYTEMHAPGSAFLASVPFCGTYGNVALMSAIAAGAHLVCTDVFDPATADALIRKYRITHSFGDDRMVGRLAELALAGPGPYDSMKFFAVARFNPNAADSVGLAVKAGLKPCALYGSSEVQAVFAVGKVELDGYGPVTPVGAHGRVAVEPLDDEDGETANPARGAMIITSDTMFVEYLDDPAATAAIRNADGWFRTGDLIEIVGESFLFEGRLGDVLRLGGFLVNPGEIENHLQLNPDVDRAQIVGVDVNGRSGAFAFVIARNAAKLDEAALIGQCRDSLARYKVPVRVVQVDDFPTTAGPNGLKISRARMREMAAQILHEDKALSAPSITG